MLNNMTYIINLFILSALIVIVLVMFIISVFVIYCIVSDVRYGRDITRFDIIALIVSIIIIFATISGIVKYIDLCL